MTKTLLIGGAVVGGLILLSSMNNSKPAPQAPRKQPAMNGLNKKKSITGKAKKSAVLKV